MIHRIQRLKRKQLKNTEKEPEGGRRATTEGIYPKTMLAEGMKIWGCPYSRRFLKGKDKIKNALIERRMFCFRF